MGKSLFNFYLDDNIKNKAIEKLDRLNGKQSKGQLAAFLRVQINLFLALPDEKISQTLLDAIKAEYEYSAKLNKRSRL